IHRPHRNFFDRHRFRDGARLLDADLPRRRIQLLGADVEIGAQRLQPQVAGGCEKSTDGGMAVVLAALGVAA
uniref:hypothetical protein n=1 Tax=Nocardia wallacei TaxID=480035 RepID=UPI002458077D